MEIGDIVLNTYAGDKNPHKISIIVNMTNKYIKCLTSTNKIIEFYKSDEHIFEVIGRVDVQGIISEYREMYFKGYFKTKGDE